MGSSRLKGTHRGKKARGVYYCDIRRLAEAESRRMAERAKLDAEVARLNNIIADMAADLDGERARVTELEAAFNLACEKVEDLGACSDCPCDGTPRCCNGRTCAESIADHFLSLSAPNTQEVEG